MKKPLKKGSMQDAYLQGMTPLEFGRLKKDKYLSLKIFEFILKILSKKVILNIIFGENF